MEPNRQTDICSRCGNKVEEHRAYKYGYCLACHSLKNKEYRKKNGSPAHLTAIIRALRFEIVELKREIKRLKK